MVTTIQVDEKVKKMMDKLKIHKRETYNDLILRMIENCSLDSEKESLSETVEVLQSPKDLIYIAEAVERYNAGVKGKSIDELRKELDL